MPLLFKNGKLIFFAHVPKTGGSSVEDYLIRRFGSLAMVDRHKHKGIPGTGLISPITHLSTLDLEEILPENLDLCFAVVRDPLKRIISEYRWQQNSSRMSRLSFSTWLRLSIGAAKKDPRIYENHIRPQSEMVPENAEFFRLEDGFDALINRLDEVTDTLAEGVEMGHLLKRSSARQVEVSREDAEIVADYYSVDYNRFGYELPDIESYKSDSFSGIRKVIVIPLIQLLLLKQHIAWVQ